MMKDLGRRGKRLGIILGIVCFQAIAGWALAASDPPPPEAAEGLTLSRAIEVALQQNPLIRASGPPPPKLAWRLILLFPWGC